MPNLTRRSLLGAAAILPFAPMAHAASPMLGPSFAQHRRFSLGAFEVTTILAGTAHRDDPQTIFGMNVSAEEFTAVSEENFISSSSVQFYFTPTVVNTGAELILFDTGLNAAGTTAALASAGYTPDQFDRVVITHMHGDHIGGLMSDGAATFANASYVAGQAEFDHWAAADNDGFEGSVRPLADQFTLVADETEISPGVTAILAAGHTPGHMTFRIDSEGAGLMILADLANHPVWSLARPDWEVRFDMDKAAAAASRRRILGLAAQDRVPVVGYHMPFPSVGYVDTAGDGFAWVPESGQLMG